MRALIQRVNKASVYVNEKLISSIQKGLLVFVGIKKDDTDKDSEYLIRKILNLRIFDGEKSFIDKSVKDLDLEILLVSQFTLYADCKKGNRPSFNKTMSSSQAKIFYQNFLQNFKRQYSKIKEGIFGAYMQIELVNDGPVTLIVSNKEL